jgi:hypothetical protein
LIGINVGFEDTQLDAAYMNQLAAQIFDVKGMIGTVSGTNAIPVGYIDNLAA